MASTATRLTRVNMRGKTVIQYYLDHDGTNDLTVHTPASGNHVFVVGWQHSDGTAANLTLKSGSTNLNILELAGNQGLYSKVQRDAYDFATDKGGALVIAAGAAWKGCMSVVEGAEF